MLKEFVFRFFIGLFLIVLLLFLLVCLGQCVAWADIRIGSDSNPTHIIINHTPVKKVTIGDGAAGKVVWEATNPPVITSFSVSPSTIDLDTRASGTITFTFGVTGQPGKVSSADVHQLPGGGNIGATFTAQAGANITGNLPNITQPQATTTYRLIARNTTGASHRDTTVTVTRNPGLSSCRRTNVIARVGFTNYTFAFTVVGLPMPTVTYRFSGGRQGTVTAGHCSQGANLSTWNCSGWNVTMPNSNAQSLILTATNTSGTNTCTLSNING